MSKDIKLLKNNENIDQSDVEWVGKFYEYLKSEGLSQAKAFRIIYYLQEHVPVFPDHIEQCSVCGELYDSYASGHYSELTNKHYCCESCEPYGLYEKEQRAAKRADAPFQKWLKKINKEQKKYCFLKGKEINEGYLRAKYNEGASIIAVLREIGTKITNPQQ